MLSQHGLNSDAFQLLMGTATRYETGIPWTRAMVTALRGLDVPSERILQILDQAATRKRAVDAEKPAEK